MSAAAERVPVGTVVTTDVPTRLDRLGWSAWHTRVVLALGITWLLDGLEASLVATLASALLSPDTLGLSATQVGAASTVYLVGQVAGALFFGWLTDRLGRKKLFLVTIAVYLGATALSGLAPNFIVFVIWRFFAGAGIGGEYSAINSAIDELIPARLRGQIDLAVNGSYWLGVAGGAALVDVVLNPRILPHAWGWRIAFGLGALIGLVILFVRRHLPESPRWYLMHGRIGDAVAEIARIEDAVRATRGTLSEAAPVRVRVSGSIGLAATARIVLGKHRRRTILGLTLMLAQTFFYNAIFFSFALILGQIYGVPEDHVGRYLLPFAAGNFLGPLCIGRLFDTLGRRTMIATTYIASGVLLIATGFAFQHGWLDATTQTICWCVVFFFASSAASSAYLTVSELFPVEIRGLAIALFYAFSTAMGAIAPSIFGAFVDMYRRTQSRTPLFLGYLIAAGLMIGAGLVARAIGVDAERKSLEDLAGAPPEDLAATRT